MSPGQRLPQLVQCYESACHCAQFFRSGAGWSGDLRQPLRELGQAVAVALQRGTFVVGEGKLLQHAFNTVSDGQ